MPKPSAEGMELRRSTISPSESVLIIIDAQNEYAEGLLTIPKVEYSRVAIESLLDRYRHARAPIIHIRYKTPPSSPVFTPGTRLAEIFEELTPLPSEPVIYKSHPGAFFQTDLADIIAGTGRDKVVLVGYLAHTCVATTARQAYQRGLEVILVREAIGDQDQLGVRAEEVVRRVLRELGGGFGTVLGLEDVR